MAPLLLLLLCFSFVFYLSFVDEIMFTKSCGTLQHCLESMQDYDTAPAQQRLLGKWRKAVLCKEKFVI